jgi:hypothetical protein
MTYNRNITTPHIRKKRKIMGKIITPGEATILNALNAGVEIAYTGNGFDNKTVKPDGTFTTTPNEGNGWHTQRNNSLMEQAAVESLIADNLIRVESTHVGGILEYTHKLVLV